MKSIEAETRERYPKKAFAADHKRSRPAAIWMKCMSCMCNQKSEIRDCEIYACGLWTVRPYGDTERPGGKVPTRAEYEAVFAAERETPEAKARIERMRKMREQRT